VEHGGPAGGNGGRGGNVWAIADGALNSLIKFKGKVRRAEPG
jgi:GTP-binding protein